MIGFASFYLERKSEPINQQQRDALEEIYKLGVTLKSGFDSFLMAFWAGEA